MIDDEDTPASDQEDEESESDNQSKKLKNWII